MDSFLPHRIAKWTGDSFRRQARLAREGHGQGRFRVMSSDNEPYYGLTPRSAERKGAAVLASLRHLANGIFELEREAKRTSVDTLKSWCQQQTFSTVWPLPQR